MSEFPFNPNSLSILQTYPLSSSILPFLISLLIFLVESSNISFRQLLFNFKWDKTLPSVLGYLSGMVIRSSIAGLIGLILSLTFPNCLLTWVTTSLFFVVGIISFLSYRIFWNRKRDKHRRFVEQF